MQNFIDAIVANLKVKSISTYMILATFMILALRGTVEPAAVKDITMIVVAFYFGTQQERKTTQRKEG